ncbi:UDP-glucose--hexose-1-phosphate uridylyltransferase [Bacillus sp. ISL-47]|uniref:UDP-glucose--hexose-1-phosphate uridylyltransferase n=1 Tax=Bacillus sp. ISL-47 TaxID=2819130 RepID=UPI001BEBD2B5|nr:UDP-glucose--hexose-1-phosphate uridylyltransferase [Bacillus sp. ISL-47]MBT2689267.1 UDP-glucose--hexose-1-phosphate uridylyltransferase [Bacillus sp. ISL-47]MBT2708608.1 UDP-glucose--hexose-1-phosphate uridylyltransferase [Pseudomonas sp. ISL-84]
MNVSIHLQIERLLQYGLQKKLITKWDTDFTRNLIYDVLQISECEKVEVEEETLDSPAEILEMILDWAAENHSLKENTVTYRDLLDTKIMGCFAARPSEFIRDFYSRYKGTGPASATEAFYQFSQEVHYIRKDRIAKNEHWFTHTEYGDLEMTINLSKPEKDPKAIEAAKTLTHHSYPECLLCKENVGYAGRVNHPARQNLRIIPLELTNEQWFLQFSPYVYYNEHAIVFKGEHDPMKISKKTFERLLEFVDLFPHYFLGSNADLPIVGGSILSHDHFQGGYHHFPMAHADMEKKFTLPHKNVTAGIVKWPMSVIRIQSHNRQELAEAANHIFNSWRAYTDESAGIRAFTDGIPHNTITPIARRNGNLFDLDLVLRNNRTSDEHPLGIFHPHQEVHHIKKENIGLIEVMGLAVLPGRLYEELRQLANCLTQSHYMDAIQGNKEIVKHIDWAQDLKKKYVNFTELNCPEILKEEVGRTFLKILEHAGVFKRDEQGQKAFLKFIQTLNKESSHLSQFI